MRSDTSTGTTDLVGPLTRRDLANFDKLATDLILEMQLEGWQGYITSRGHAMMRHPDGSHQSLTRSSNRAKSGTAMRARYESWKRRRAEREAAAGSAFGVIPEEPMSMPVPVPTLLEMRKQERIKTYIDDAFDGAGDTWEIVGFHEDPRAWAVFDLANPYPVLIGHGSTTNEQGAWAALMLERPDVFPEPETEESDQQEDVMASVFVCPEPGCGKQFDQKRKASVHNAAAHHREPASCPVPGCGWEGEKHTLKRHHDAVHDSTVHPCPFCGQEFGTLAGLSMHRSRKHKGLEPPTVTVTHLPDPAEPDEDQEGATVAPQGPDVLLEHLEHLPEGDDAEAMVAKIRSIVAGPLVAEVRRLREELVQVTKERDKFAGEAADFEARLTLMREVMGV